MKHKIPMALSEAAKVVDQFCYDYSAILSSLQYRYLIDALCGDPTSLADADRVSGKSYVVAALAIICATRCGERVCIVASNVVSAQLAFENIIRTLQMCHDRNTKQLLKVRGSTRSIYVKGGFCSGGEIAVVTCTAPVRPGVRYDRALIDADGDQHALDLCDAYASKIV